MTLKLTEKDKKLLVVLVVVALVFGLGAGILYPLVKRTQELSVSVEDARTEKAEREEKVLALPALTTEEKTINKNIKKLQKQFYPVMKSMEIDQLLTEMSVSQGIEMKSLDIAMPSAEEYAQVSNYVGNTDIGQTAAQTAENADANAAANDGTYAGIYSAQVQLVMSGDREALQTILDSYSGLEPKIRVVSFNWQSSQDQKTATTLGVSLELYMYQNADQYIEEQKKLAEQEAVADTAAADETAEAQ